EAAGKEGEQEAAEEGEQEAEAVAASSTAPGPPVAGAGWPGRARPASPPSRIRHGGRPGRPSS
ncbi:MAG: hypothetical protein M3O23_12645, partial [Actinomycetota bacterium]|nr:hypothetical protein [Actinomycetota bacterium]